MNNPSAEISSSGHTEAGPDRLVLNEAVESVPLGVLAVAADRRILICNRNAEFIFNLRRGAILNRDYSEVLPSVLAQTMNDLIGSISNREGSSDREFSYAINPGTTLQIGISIMPMTESGDHAGGSIFVLRDMTLTREAQTLRELNRLNLEFIRTVSHEVKTPLMAILMGTDYLLGRANTLAPEQRETLETIDQGAERLQELVADLLDLVNFESGNADLETEPCDIIAMASRVARSFKKLPDIEISLKVGAQINPFPFDSRKIHRVLENLVANAIKYSPHRAVVTIAVTRDEDRVEVSVSDSGVGIPPEHLPHIWDKFYRVASSATGKAPGTGLGLAIAKQIIAMHGGAIRVESVPNKGSTFSFTLPLSRAR